MRCALGDGTRRGEKRLEIIKCSTSQLVADVQQCFSFSVTLQYILECVVGAAEPSQALLS